MTALPLDGIKVRDLNWIHVGPWLTVSLANLGAEAWKIGNIRGGDDTRAWTVQSFKGVIICYLCSNCGKHSVAVDLKTGEGRQIVLDLAARADVIVENFRAGSVDRLGIRYEDIRAINPGIVYCSISGYGQTGPKRTRPGYDYIMQPESGLMSIAREVDGPPNRLGVAFTDVVAGIVALQSIIAAPYQRRDTGEGQFIDVVLLDTRLNLLIIVGTGYLNAGVEAKRFGNAHPTVVQYRVLQTADGSFALAVGNDRMFAAFCTKVIGRHELAADRFTTVHQRALNRPALLEIMQEGMLTQPSQHWLDACAAADVRAGPVKSVSEALSAPSVVERGVIQQVEHPELGTISLIRATQGLAAQNDPYRPAKAPPLLGEDARAVMRDVLGLGRTRSRGSPCAASSPAMPRARPPHPPAASPRNDSRRTGGRDRGRTDDQLSRHPASDRRRVAPRRDR